MAECSYIKTTNSLQIKVFGLSTRVLRIALRRPIGHEREGVQPVQQERGQHVFSFDLSVADSINAFLRSANANQKYAEPVFQSVNPVRFGFGQ